ncbi:MAG: chorismate-binding protein [Acidobacteriota bacterium]
MELLLIDHYDSFTWNLAHLLESVLGRTPRVVSHDRLRSRDLASAQAVVLSPGPGQPSRRSDFRLGIEGLEALAERPVFGVCLGHQAMALAAGGVVERAPRPVHGEIERVEHEATGLFAGLPRPLEVVRYHSLAVREPLPQPLRATAHSLDGVLMALEWIGRPWWGVQFHPESVGSTGGRGLAENFLRLAREHRALSLSPEQRPSVRSQSRDGEASQGAVIRAAAERSAAERSAEQVAPPVVGQVGELRLCFRPLPASPQASLTPERAFAAVARDAARRGFGTFWLDHARAADSPGAESPKTDSSETDPPEPSSPEMGAGVWSYLGAGSGALSYRVTEAAEMRTAGSLHRLEGAWEEVLGQVLGDRAPRSAESTEPPFTFRGGLVGYLGYEMKREGIDGGLSPQSVKGDGSAAPVSAAAGASPAGSSSNGLPDAAFLLAHRFLAFDHREGRLWAAALFSENPSPDTVLGGEAEARAWLDEIEESLRTTAPLPVLVAPHSADLRSPSLRLQRSQAQYLRDIEASLEAIRSGESYELCLTNQLRGRFPNLNPFLVYRWLRRRNPAPYAAWLDLRSAVPGGPAVVSSSPERFLRLNAEGEVSAKPIKGTRARGATPREDAEAREDLATHVKDRAENLMIADLLRNDLGRVALPGSVEVPRLMEVETYATVHQLVSTVTARLDPRAGVEDLLAATFPGGSMTGAPKRRTMEILETLEASPRGVYSGALGWLGYGAGRPGLESLRGTGAGAPMQRPLANRGGADLSIVIRAAIFSGDEVSIGAGGAIVARSRPQDELEEMLIKARPVIDALAHALASSSELASDSMKAEAPAVEKGTNAPEALPSEAADSMRGEEEESRLPKVGTRFA